MSFRLALQQGLGSRTFSTVGKSRLQDLYHRVQASPEGKEAIRKYGECLERQVDDIRKDCCLIEYQEISRIAAEIEKAGAKQ